MMISSCNTQETKDYKVDRIIISEVKCHPIDNSNDSGNADCPIIAISIDKYLRYFITKGNPYSSKLECYSGTISYEIWDSIYNNFVIMLLKDSISYDAKSYNRKLESHEIESMYDGHDYLILLYHQNNNIKTIRSMEHDFRKYKPVFDKFIKIGQNIDIKKMNDTCLIRLSDYLLMPPSLVNKRQK